MKLFDTHCHLNNIDLYNDLDNVLNRAFETGVKAFLVVGYDKESSHIAVKLAKQYDSIYAAIGFHPTEIDVSEEDFNEVMTLLDEEKVVALGEIGLDYHWVKDEAQREKQKQYFIRQIDIANEHNLPIVVHGREAFEDCFTIIKNHTPKMGGVMHCYSGPSDKIDKLIELGMYISLGGPVTFLNGKKPKESALATPLEYLLIETDCPYLAPHPFRGKQNEPKNVFLVAKEIASLKGKSVEEICDITFNNAKKLFHIE